MQPTSIPLPLFLMCLFMSSFSWVPLLFSQPLTEDAVFECLKCLKKTNKRRWIQFFFKFRIVFLYHYVKNRAACGEFSRGTSLVLTKKLSEKFLLCLVKMKTAFFFIALAIRLNPWFVFAREKAKELWEWLHNLEAIKYDHCEKLKRQRYEVGKEIYVLVAKCPGLSFSPEGRVRYFHIRLIPLLRSFSSFPVWCYHNNNK